MLRREVMVSWIGYDWCKGEAMVGFSMQPKDEAHRPCRWIRQEAQEEQVMDNSRGSFLSSCVIIEVFQ